MVLIHGFPYVYQRVMCFSYVLQVGGIFQACSFCIPFGRFGDDLSATQSQMKSNQTDLLNQSSPSLGRLWTYSFKYPLVIKHGVLEKGPLFSDFPINNIYIYIRIIKTSIITGFSIAMFDYQRVNHGNVNSTKVLSFCS